MTVHERHLEDVVIGVVWKRAAAPPPPCRPDDGVDACA